MNPCELTAAVTALANYLSQSYDDDTLTLLAAVLVQLGDTLVTILESKNFCSKANKADAS